MAYSSTTRPRLFIGDKEVKKGYTQLMECDFTPLSSNITQKKMLQGAWTRKLVINDDPSTPTKQPINVEVPYAPKKKSRIVTKLFSGCVRSLDSKATHEEKDELISMITKQYDDILELKKQISNVKSAKQKPRVSSVPPVKWKSDMDDVLWGDLIEDYEHVISN